MAVVMVWLSSEPEGLTRVMTTRHRVVARHLVLRKIGAMRRDEGRDFERIERWPMGWGKWVPPWR